MFTMDDIMYSVAKILFIKALTPLHVGTGRGEGAHVDLPIQRDEFGYPTIWASSLKGAIKAHIGKNNKVREYLGSEPGMSPTRPSHISLLDARLVLMPVRVLEGVWAYGTTPHLLNYLKYYLDVYNEISLKQSASSKLELRLDLIKSMKRKGLSNKFKDLVIINETDLEIEYADDLISKIGVDKIFPSDIRDKILEQGLIILSDENNIGLNILNKSLLIQYRVRLKGEEKTVEEGPWSEEYLPMETVFVSLILCRDYKSDGSSKSGVEICEEFKNEIDKKTIYVGGRETIGRGLAKLFII
jgi:CRISPR-associated protein Cmr4